MRVYIEFCSTISFKKQNIIVSCFTNYVIYHSSNIYIYICACVCVCTGCVDLWDTKVIRSSCGSHFRMPISYGISWEQINDENEGSVLLADCSWFSEYENESKKRKPNKFVDDNNNSDHAVSTSSALPVVPYHCVHYNKLSPAILVIGGETEGLSNESIDFASKRNGIRVNIPLSNYVDSLNSGVALGVILFEIKRNLLTSANQ